MSDTPRTDVIALDIVETLTDETLTQNKDEWVECVAREIRPLERELAQAQQTIDTQHGLMVTAENRGVAKGEEENRELREQLAQAQEIITNESETSEKLLDENAMLRQRAEAAVGSEQLGREENNRLRVELAQALEQQSIDDSAIRELHSEVSRLHEQLAQAQAACKEVVQFDWGDPRDTIDRIIDGCAQAIQKP